MTNRKILYSVGEAHSTLDWYWSMILPALVRVWLNAQHWRRTANKFNCACLSIFITGRTRKETGSCIHWWKAIVVIADDYFITWADWFLCQAMSIDWKLSSICESSLMTLVICQVWPRSLEGCLRKKNHCAYTMLSIWENEVIIHRAARSVCKSTWL